MPNRRGTMPMTRIAVVFLAFLTLAPASTTAWPAADFYKGRQVTLIVGYGTGGGYDVYARLMARHLGRHIPGNPTLVPQNMPGAGSLKALMYIYEVAAKDGLSFGTVGRSEPLAPLLTPDE